MRLIWLFAAGAAVCAAQPDQRTAAVQLADQYAAAYQVPRELVHSIIEVESGWHPSAVSSKGAVGLMQLMPATAATLGSRTASRSTRTSEEEWRIWPDF